MVARSQESETFFACFLANFWTNVDESLYRRSSHANFILHNWHERTIILHESNKKWTLFGSFSRKIFSRSWAVQYAVWHLGLIKLAPNLCSRSMCKGDDHTWGIWKQYLQFFLASFGCFFCTWYDNGTTDTYVYMPIWKTLPFIQGNRGTRNPYSLPSHSCATLLIQYENSAWCLNTLVSVTLVIVQYHMKIGYGRYCDFCDVMKKDWTGNVRVETYTCKWISF